MNPPLNKPSKARTRPPQAADSSQSQSRLVGVEVSESACVQRGERNDPILGLSLSHLPHPHPHKGNVGISERKRVNCYHKALFFLGGFSPLSQNNDKIITFSLSNFIKGRKREQNNRWTFSIFSQFVRWKGGDFPPPPHTPYRLHRILEWTLRNETKTHAHTNSNNKNCVQNGYNQKLSELSRENGWGFSMSN